MKKKSTTKQTDKLGAFQTASFADIDKRMHDSLVAIPREEAVTDAKHWVDKNQK